LEESKFLGEEREMIVSIISSISALSLMPHQFLPLATWKAIFVKQSNSKSSLSTVEVGCNIPENKMMMIDPQELAAKRPGPAPMASLAQSE
jgi:hypothetical protein